MSCVHVKYKVVLLPGNDTMCHIHIQLAADIQQEITLHRAGDKVAATSSTLTSGDLPGLA
jgi:hypothetical protein